MTQETRLRVASNPTRGWQANKKTHLCVASGIRAMPETEKPPAMRVDIYLIVVWGDLKEILIPVVVITCLSTVIVMVCTGKVTQTLIRRKQKTGEMKDERVIK